MYLMKPLTDNQSKHLLKFLMVVNDLELISESCFADTYYFFDEYSRALTTYGWEAPPPKWLSGGI